MEKCVLCKHIFPMPIIIFFLRIFLSIIFIVSGVSKLFDLTYFIITIKSLDILPNIFVPTIALIISVIELILGILLFVGLYTKLTTLGMLALLLIFMIVILPDALIGGETDCGCFGNIVNEKIDFMLIIRDIILVIMTIVVFNQNKYRSSYDREYQPKGKNDSVIQTRKEVIKR